MEASKPISLPNIHVSPDSTIAWSVIGLSIVCLSLCLPLRTYRRSNSLMNFSCCLYLFVYLSIFVLSFSSLCLLQVLSPGPLPQVPHVQRPLESTALQMSQMRRRLSMQGEDECCSLTGIFKQILVSDWCIWQMLASDWSYGPMLFSDWLFQTKAALSLVLSTGPLLNAALSLVLSSVPWGRMFAAGTRMEDI